MISVATSLVTLLGMWLISRKDWRGWMVGLANQALWLWLIIDTHAWGLLILTVSLVVLYTKAIIRWRRDDQALIVASRIVAADEASQAHSQHGGTQ